MIEDLEGRINEISATLRIMRRKAQHRQEKTMLESSRELDAISLRLSRLHELMEKINEQKDKQVE